MKLTNEALKQIIKEELEAVLEANVDRFGQKQNRSRIVTKDRQPPTSTMDLQTAIAFLEFGWDGLEDDQRELIETFAQSLHDNIVYGKASDFRAHSKEQYDALIAAIEKTKGEQ